MWRSAVQLCTGLRGISSVGLEHLLCKQGVKGSTPLFSTNCYRFRKETEARQARRGTAGPQGQAEETIDMLRKK